jgi:hypothetical protein
MSHANFPHKDLWTKPHSSYAKTSNSSVEESTCGHCGYPHTGKRLTPELTRAERAAHNLHRRKKHEKHAIEASG